MATLASWSATEAKKLYIPAKILDIQEKARTRVLYYLVNTPVTQDDPYFEVSVQLKDTVYLAEYTPIHRKDTLPDDWKVDTVVQARVEKHYLFLQRPSGGEIQLVIIKRRPASDPAVSKP